MDENTKKRPDKFRAFYISCFRDGPPAVDFIKCKEFTTRTLSRKVHSFKKIDCDTSDRKLSGGRLESNKEWILSIKTLIRQDLQDYQDSFLSVSWMRALKPHRLRRINKGF